MSFKQQLAIADPQFGTSLTRYPYQSSMLLAIRRFEKTMFQIADRRLLIADVCPISESEDE